jgi:O-antigen ligase
LLVILAASLAATVVGLSLTRSMLSLLAEGYLLLLLVCVANDLASDRRGLRAILAVWSVAALGWAAVFVGLHFSLLPLWLQGLLPGSAPEGARAAGAAGNPNLGASYLMTSFFVLAAAPWPRHRLARLVAAGWVLLGLYATGSNGALLGLAAGLPVLLVAAGLRRTRTPGERLAVVGAALLGGGLLLGTLVTATGVPQVGVSDLRALASHQRAGVFGESLGRLDRSVSGRLTTWSHGWNAAGSGMVVGVGPGAAPEIPLAGSTLRRGLHNDYLAFLIERGVVGLLGLLALAAVLLRWSARLLDARLPDGHGRWSPAGLGAAVVANLVLASNHESFHFRHLWILVGLTWAACQLVTGPRPAPAVGILPDQTAKELAHAGQ